MGFGKCYRNQERDCRGNCTAFKEKQRPIYEPASPGTFPKKIGFEKYYWCDVGRFEIEGKK